jgi:hypothetical protein
MGRHGLGVLHTICGVHSCSSCCISAEEVFLFGTFASSMGLGWSFSILVEGVRVTSSSFVGVDNRFRLDLEAASRPDRLICSANLLRAAPN